MKSTVLKLVGGTGQSKCALALIYLFIIGKIYDFFKTYTHYINAQNELCNQIYTLLIDSLTKPLWFDFNNH